MSWPEWHEVVYWCLAHVKELVEQNHENYEKLWFTAPSVFSASLNKKEASKQVVFGSVQSVCRNLNHFNDSRFTLLIIDECHRVSLTKSSSYHQVINYLQKFNPQLKVLGLTATPYRLGMGWLYQYHKTDNHPYSLRTEEERFFKDCIFELPTIVYDQASVSYLAKNARCPRRFL